MNAETRSLLDAARLAVQMDAPVLEMLLDRRAHSFWQREYVHDKLLREYLEVHTAWWQQVITEIEQHGDAYTLPPVPEILTKA